MFLELNTLQSFSGHRWAELDRETRLSILACRLAVEAIRVDVRKEAEAENKAKTQHQRAKQHMADAAAMERHFKRKGVNPDKMRAFMQSGEDG